MYVNQKNLCMTNKTFNKDVHTIIITLYTSCRQNYNIVCMHGIHFLQKDIILLENVQLWDAK